MFVLLILMWINFEPGRVASLEPKQTGIEMIYQQIVLLYLLLAMLETLSIVEGDEF